MAEKPRNTQMDSLPADVEKDDSISQADFSHRLKVHKMTVLQTALTLVATNLGGGILGVAFAFSRLGLYYGVALVLIVATISHISNMMYLKTKDLTPSKSESIYEIAYLLTGRSSIFVICSILFAANFGAMLLFYIIIGDTVSNLMKQALIEPSNEVMAQDLDLSDYPWYVDALTNRTTAIFLAGLGHLTIIFKR